MSELLVLQEELREAKAEEANAVEAVLEEFPDYDFTVFVRKIREWGDNNSE